MIILKVTSRLGFKNGDYVEEITDGKAIMIYENVKVAKNHVKAMLEQQHTSGWTYDGDKRITFIHRGLNEEEIYKKEAELLEYVIKNKVAFQKIRYSRL
jgi:uncharacterized protein YehS (DUF1456 family)